MTSLGVQTAKECMLKHIVQRGILGSMAEESVVSSSSSVTSNGQLSEEDLAEYSSLVRPYQDKPLAREDTTKTNSMQMGSLALVILQDRYERAKAATVPYLLCVSSFFSPVAIRIR